MTARFLSNTPFAGTEIEMQQIPGFRPRRSGMSIRRFSYTPADCDCHNCTKKAEKKNECSPIGCICLRERLMAGCIPFCELLEVMNAEIDTVAFSARVSRLSTKETLFFTCDQHRLRFWKLWKTHRPVPEEAALCAAVYLLSADAFLWSKTVEAIKSDFIDFSVIQIHGVDLGGYVIFHAAKDLYKGTKHLSLSELTDPELVNDEVFRLVVAAFLIRRYGAEVLCVERRSQ